MEEGKTNEPASGTWANLSTENQPRHDKVNFEINIPETVTFINDEPQEMPSHDGKGVYYIFSVKQEDQERVIMTSAWTLLRALKQNSPLTGKKLTIVKKLINGKQTFEVMSAS